MRMLAVHRKEPGNLFSPRDSGTVVCENILVGHEPCNYRCCAARYLDGALTRLFSILSALIGSPLFLSLPFWKFFPTVLSFYFSCQISLRNCRKHGFLYDVKVLSTSFVRRVFTKDRQQRVIALVFWNERPSRNKNSRRKEKTGW